MCKQCRMYRKETMVTILAIRTTFSSIGSFIVSQDGMLVAAQSLKRYPMISNLLLFVVLHDLTRYPNALGLCVSKRFCSRPFSELACLKHALRSFTMAGFRCSICREHTSELEACWFCTNYVCKWDHYWCREGCGYELCKTCQQKEPSVALIRHRGVWKCPDCAGKSSTSPGDVYTGPPHGKKFRCPSCGENFRALHKCWECSDWTCRKCSYWCTLCPRGDYKYGVCGACYQTGHFLKHRPGSQVWCCSRCFVP